MATIVDGIDSVTQRVTVSGISVAPGTNLSIDDEIVTYRGTAQDPLRPYIKQPANLWRVLRGQAGSTAAPHEAGATIAVKVKEYGPQPIDAGGGASDAASVTYDNAESGLTAEDVQAALDEVAAEGGGGLPAGFAVDPEDETYLQSELGNIRLGLVEGPFTDLQAGIVAIQGDAGLSVVDAFNDGTFQFTAASSGLVVVTAEAVRLNINATGLGFYGEAPSAQPAAVADATDNPSAITQLNDLLAKLRTLGLIDT